MVKKYKNSGIETPEATKIIEAVAKEKILALSNDYSAKVLIPVRYNEESINKAVGETPRISFYDISKKLKGEIESD